MTNETDAVEATAKVGGSLLEAVVRPPHFVCTACLISFPGENYKRATCPKCGDTYHGNFFTKLIREGTFALAYWADANHGIEVKPWSSQ